MTTTRTLFVLGGSGFIGRATLAAAVAAGHRVLALARSDAAAATVAALGAEPVLGDATSPERWIDAAAGSDVLIDLTQPSLPRRLTRRALRDAAAVRVTGAERLSAALAALPPDQRPLLVGVSGTDDLLPDPTGRLSSRSPLRDRPRGFAHIGLPVRAAVERSGIDACHVYFGNLVYGPGKAYADTVVAGITTGKARVIGSGANRLPLTSVTDAAAALCHLAALDPAALGGRTVVAVPDTPATQRDLFDLTAAALRRRTPTSVPAPVAALVAGRVSAEAITLDAVCDSDVLTGTGFRFAHEDLAEGVAAALAALPSSPAPVA